MLFRFGPLHRAAGWLLTVLGLVALAFGARGYLTDAPVRPAWVLGGLLAVAGGSALVRWARRAGPS